VSYALLADLRAEGVTPTQCADLRAQALLDAATAFIDDYTGQWFEPRELTLDLDGTDGELLWLPAPPLRIDSVSVDDVALDLATDVVTYGPPLHRDNPRLARRRTAPFTLHTHYGARRTPVWRRGQQNVRIVGSFGYVAQDGTSPPAEIRLAALRLAIRDLALLTDVAGQGERRRGDLVSETTDGSSYTLAGAQANAPGGWRRSGTTGDPDIDRALLRYRRAPYGGLAR
jgi:hypothetical protein